MGRLENEKEFSYHPCSLSLSFLRIQPPTILSPVFLFACFRKEEMKVYRKYDTKPSHYHRHHPTTKHTYKDTQQHQVNSLLLATNVTNSWYDAMESGLAVQICISLALHADSLACSIKRLVHADQLHLKVLMI